MNPLSDYRRIQLIPTVLLVLLAAGFDLGTYLLARTGSAKTAS